MMRDLLAMLVLVPVALGVEGVALLMLLAASGPLPAQEVVALFSLHLFSSVVMVEALGLRYPPGSPAAGGGRRLGLGLSLLMPGFGLLMVAVLVIRLPRKALVKEDGEISPMEYRKQQAEAQLAAEAAQQAAGVEVEAISEALKDTDKAKRLGAVEALRSMEGRQAVELLGQSLQNTVFEVRYHAVEALAGINKKYSQRIAKATAAAEKTPGPANHRALGEIYFEYAALQMEDPSIQLHLFRNASEHLRRSFTQDAQPDAGVLNKMAYSMEQLGEADQARRIYNSVLKRHPDSADALLGIARLQFESGQFDQLRDTCRRILGLEHYRAGQEYEGVLLMWAEGLQAAGVPR